jgi:transcription initiation factor TFIID TATA-box-binding protein
MGSTNIVNVVGSGDLQVEIDLVEVANDIQQAKYDDEHRPAPPTLQLESNNSLILVYRTGTYAIRGARSIEEIETAKNKLLNEFTHLGIIEEPVDPNFVIRNVVCTDDLSKNIDLGKLAIKLGLENTEYEPEQFPGLVYRPPSHSCVLLIFSSGKVIATGSETEQIAKAAIESLKSIT